MAEGKSEKAVRAKKTLKAFVGRIESELQHYFEGEIGQAEITSHRERKVAKQVLKHIMEHNMRPAKRLRASFVYWGYKLLGGKKEKEILKTSMFIELIHTAALMHDDIMDQDDTRRGRPTSHEYYRKVYEKKYKGGNAKHWGESMAIDAGDAAFYLGNEILSKSGFNDRLKIKALNRLFRGVVRTAWGQAFDITLEAQKAACEKDILDLHLAKTSVYTYETPLHVGALLAGATNRDLELISEYAIPGGIAFQLQDDILGFYGDPKKTGKPAHSDLRQGKMTLLIISALKNGSKRQTEKLCTIWGKRDLTGAEAEEARKIIIETGSLDYSRRAAVKWAKRAQRAIPKMKKRGWNSQAIDYLDGIIQYMIDREV